MWAKLGVLRIRALIASAKAFFASSARSVLFTLTLLEFLLPQQ